MNLDKMLYTLKYTPDDESHLKPDNEKCKICKSRNCTYICPAHVYEWDEELNKLIVNYENCLECGACRIACEHHCIDWRYPKGTKGVTFKQG
ncbi:MAG TPA: 4Fe-4S ferredoxin [Cyanobacteria bacterium UBA11991]|nr:4Fe-4S dicluster domain-containing protein [Cyanobacteriota bacterium]MDY6358543.1 4Fe-4S dicluster domain-containing protein [Cyanobacteriota bacterium]MDY6363528.1 4Fe-4S dicluster domain-containing protein [Cyanobacteriota bacterium]MDY6382655.1 4Fe-4S dicluster domain-containing protein [Cyanobacteriota bacterium]HCB11279.1 4Fe-4S ferredoxin [Cyanobacteria bacterium UBA11991]